MIRLEIPGRSDLVLEHLVMDFNGTLACDGQLLPGVAAALGSLAGALVLHVLTADTFGGAEQALRGLPCELHILAPGEQDAAKRDFVTRLGAAHTAAIGNGANDRAMLAAAALGIAVIQAEGADPRTVLAADVVCMNVTDALALLVHPVRIRATLRC